MGKQKLIYDLAVFDLDGTIVKGNTLHIYMRCAIIESLRRYEFGAFFRIIAFAAARSLRLCSHLTMKNGILGALDPSLRMRDDFRRRVRRALSPEALSLAEDCHEKGMKILLATAASEIYVPWIWRGDYLATPPLSREECRGGRKLRLACEYAEKHGLTIHTVVSDHADDIPLLGASTATERILINPSEDTIRRVAEAGIRLTGIIRPNGYDGCGQAH